MSNPVMNYSQFMSAFKKAESGYRGKANTSEGGKSGTAKVNQELAKGPVKGAGTPELNAQTKKHLANIKAKSASKK